MSLADWLGVIVAVLTIASASLRFDTLIRSLIHEIRGNTIATRELRDRLDKVENFLWPPSHPFH